MYITTTGTFDSQPLVKINKGYRGNTINVSERLKQIQKIKGLTNIIWSCSNLIEENIKDKKKFQSVEQYTH